ncbi:TPA: hypothetical protein N0F65_009335 [Lagenidium giganteum]|uniref:DDE-1 domain-containing protein n=1 Tax=Lagenidium giganteum TaxID=4803 RepID=A0AAV2YGM1_9STRA|nr:TPA: hypothetical protein N0F65_009335 [Lagenidium giganteum]
MTLAVATKVSGSDRRPLLFIGTSKVPRPLKDRVVETEIGVKYTNSQNAWINSNIYCEWLKALDADIRQQDRQILLLEDSVSSHKHDSLELTNVRVAKLPPNTAAVLQPLDQGIIKDNFFAVSAGEEYQRFKNGKPYEPINIYTAMKICADAWKEVSDETIQNCWRHTKIAPSLNVPVDLRSLLN